MPLQQRHLFSAKVVITLMVLLAVLALFFRLEDATRGYYTRPLLIGLVVSVAAIGVGLWLVW